MRAPRRIVCQVVLFASAGAAPLAAQADSANAGPRKFEFIRNVPGTLATAGRSVVHTSSVPGILAVGALTALLFAGDERIYEETQRAARSIGLERDHPEWALRVRGVKMFYAPTTLSSGLYYLGDGWTTMLVAGSFYASGKFGHDARALQTASEIVESMLALGIVTQSIKHMTGRQTPGAATEPRGRWRPFANWKEYSANTPQFDAFPSGHLATAMATVTVISANYPDNRFVRPIGYSLMAGLSFAMINSGVHWASDYPLAIAIGRTIGRVAARRGGADERGRRAVEPLITPQSLGVTVRW